MLYFVKFKISTGSFCDFYRLFIFQLVFYPIWMKIISKFREISGLHDYQVGLVLDRSGLLVLRGPKNRSFKHQLSWLYFMIFTSKQLFSNENEKKKKQEKKFTQGSSQTSTHLPSLCLHGKFIIIIIVVLSIHSFILSSQSVISVTSQLLEKKKIRKKKDILYHFD